MILVVLDKFAFNEKRCQSFVQYVPVSRGTAFDGEISAIRRALPQLQCHLEKFTRVIILSDSRVTLLAVVSDNNSITQDVLVYRHDLKILSSLGKIIVLQWVPAHCGIPGNENADFLAKKGALVMQKVSRPLFSFIRSKIWLKDQSKSMLRKTSTTVSLTSLGGMLS
ncbi:RNase H domain-containing protein [Trichonephila clavipes]|uniref:RNase H domain-containing protein n=1 Tax=Trichonephila clavipes TaxID=2585209 RepID=A0A8X6RJV7_TRICX|nr:RNase H domain-containing protein [Trichonephila clavipes]